MGGVEGARWQSDAQLHLTLRFLGELDRHGATDVATALGHVAFAPLSIALSGLGSFARRGVVDTLWAGAAPRPPLEHLHHKIDRACIQAGIAPDERAYLPHVTLARLNRSAGSIEPFLALHAGFATPAFTVDSFCLFESTLGRGGADYRIIERYCAR